jgi:hypothetical protein
MDIQLFDNDKELVFPDFELLFYPDDNIVVFMINNFQIEEQKKFTAQLTNLSANNIILTNNSVMLKINKSYFFNISQYSEYNISLNFTLGNYDLMFAFSDLNGKMIDNKYKVFKLNGIEIN